jgi:signal transduction histidine kinase
MFQTYKTREQGMRNQLLYSGWFAICAIGICLMAYASAQSTNPIARAARMIDPELVRVEERIDWLEGRLSTISEAQNHPLSTDIGHRGSRIEPTDPAPSVTIDLGKSYPIDMIYLVPAQGEFAKDPGMFPLRLTLESSDSEDFSNSTRIHQTDTKTEPVLDTAPLAYPAEAQGRYVRLTVDQGVQRGGMEIFALSEILVMSGNEPVSFGSRITSVGALLVDGIWHPDTLVDGRTPFGTWHNGIKNPPTTGDAVFTPSPALPTVWSLNLAEARPIDRVVLFPYEINRSFGTFVFPETIRIILEQNGTESANEVWNNPLPGGTHLTPLVVSFHRAMADKVIIRAEQPWTMGVQMIHALSEIEIWSDGTNLAQGRFLLRTHNNIEEKTESLSDGYSSVQQIISVGSWFQQLHDRRRFEDELQRLRPLRRNLEESSELHAAWGSAVLIGLTFLIPVFVVERRRLMSREHLNILRKRIASDLHDDIGSNLGSISLIARSARKDLIRLQGPPEVADDLTEVESIARESSLAMRDIVWLLERKQDTIGDLFQRMRETANRLLREIDFTLECDSTKTASRLSLDAKRHLFLFYKEAIHNVLKHSHATQVKIRMWDEDDKLALEIADNGIGIQPKSGQTGTPLVKLEERARILDAQILVSSSEKTGTRVGLIVKRSLLNTHRASN